MAEHEYEIERLAHMWYQNHEEYEKNPEWAHTIETYNTEELRDGIKQPIIYFRDESGEWDEAWISSNVCVNLRRAR